MKFDCIIGNPPFNDESSTLKTASHGNTKRMTKKLHLTFLDKSITSTEKDGTVAIICPATKWWIGANSEKNRAEYTKKGMRNVLNASKNGNAFDGALVDNVGVFQIILDGKQKLEKNEFEITIPKPKIAITDVFKFYSHPSNNKRGEFENSLMKAGKYKVWGTVSVNGYTNNNTFIDDRSRGQWRVIFNHIYGASKEHFGPIEIAHPDDFLSYTVSCIAVNNFNEARILETYLKTDAKNTIKLVKTSPVNSGEVCSYIDGAQFAEVI